MELGRQLKGVKKQASQVWWHGLHMEPVKKLPEGHLGSEAGLAWSEGLALTKAMSNSWVKV